MKKITRTMKTTNVVFTTKEGAKEITLFGEFNETKSVRKALEKIVDEEFFINDYRVTSNLYEVSVEDFMRVARKVEE